MDDAEATDAPERALLEQGERRGRFVVLHDLEGRTHAIGAGAVCAMTETDDGSLLLLPGGRLLHVPQPLWRVLAWLDGQGPVKGWR